MKSLGKGTSRSFLKTLGEYKGNKNLIFEKFVEVIHPKFQHGYAPALALEGPHLKICDSELT